MRGDCKLWGFFMCVSYKFSWGWELHTGTALEAASSFRTFDAARDEFIVQKGYTANRSNKDAKVKFIKHKFEEAGNANTEAVSEEAYKPWWILRRNEPEDGGTGAWSMPGCRIDWLYTGMSRVKLLFCRKGGSGLRRFRLKIILLCFASQKQVLLVLCKRLLLINRCYLQLPDRSTFAALQPVLGRLSLRQSVHQQYCRSCQLRML